jgi:CarD family transcriptional regulator
MASAKNRKKDSETGLGPGASEVLRKIDSSAKVPADAVKSKIPRVTPSTQPRLENGARAEPLRPATKVGDATAHAEKRAVAGMAGAAVAKDVKKPRSSHGEPRGETHAVGAGPEKAPVANEARPRNEAETAAALPSSVDPQVNFAPISNDRKPVTKKNQMKAGVDQQASASSSSEAIRHETASPVEASAAAGNVVKPTVRVPAAKAAHATEATPGAKSSVKPASADRGGIEAARAKPVARPSERAAPITGKPAKASSASRLGFKPQEFIVYPAHGVGQIVAIEEQEVAGFKLELFVISFIKDKMILKVPTSKAAMVGMRKLADADVVKKAFDTLGGRARIKRTMWSRRAQEYEAKINSGDLVAIAEVVRDLYRSDSQPEQSYSERQLYEAALDRMTREIIVVQKLTETEALRVIEAQLQKGPRRGKSEESETDEAEIEEAA